MARDVFIVLDAEDPSRARVKSFFDETNADPIVIYRSDNDTWRFHWLKKNPASEINRPFVYGERPNSFKVGAGVVDATPTGGTYTITGPSGGTTSAIAYDASAATVQTAVRASLTGFTNAIVSLIATGVYEIDRGATTAVSDITANADGLVPSGSTVNITNIQNGTSLLNEKWQLRLRKALPFLHTTGSTAFASAAVNAPSILQAGSATARKVYAISWNSDAVGGSVYLNVSTTGADNQTVGPIPYNASAEEVETAFIDGHSAIEDGEVTVAQTGTGSYTVSFALAMANNPTIATSSNDLVVPVGDECDIVMETGGADGILLGESEADITFEMEVRPSIGKSRTFAEDATLRADLIPNTPGTTDGETWATVDDVYAGRTLAAEDTSDLPTLDPDFEGQYAWLTAETYKFHVSDGTSAGDWASEMSAETGFFRNLTTSSVATLVVTVTTTYTVTANDHTILANAAGGAFDVDLPTAVGNSGRILVIKKIDATANTVSIDPNGTEHIDGNGAGNALPLSVQYESVMIQSDGTKWHILSFYDLV